MASKVLREPIKFSLEEELKKCPDLKMSDIKMLQEWREKQKHLPDCLDEFMLLFLHSNYGSIEATKNTVESYFTLRTHIPEFFSNRDPLGSKELRAAFNSVVCFGLPGRTKEGYAVIFTRLRDTNPANYVFNDACKYFFMACEMFAMKVGVAEGCVCVADATGVSLGHVGRLTPMGVKKLLCYVQDALPTRLKAVHFTNTPPAMDIIMSMAKPFMKKELYDMTHFHSSLKSFEKVFPIDILPSDVGGKAPSTEELRMDCIKEIEHYREWFKEEEHLRVNESLRVGKSKTSGDLFGVEGSFKKLDID